ncbi:SDR family NAD(P)-dependent oxidoreductase [Streptomyces sp. NPDC091272]|uniref:SDR family NAD(P)-dependent oxidoreductase n=1 Tax=Streptomyces sp. NPDC091272 TaxID=3365981 RepID=UPI00381ECDB5
MVNLSGKAALVTGGSRGIGAAIVRRLAEDGADVAFTYVNAHEQAAALVKELTETGRSAIALQADSADPDALTGAVESAAAALGRLDILVNNAGITVSGPVRDVTVPDIDRVLAVNVRAVIIGVQAALRHLPPGGRIVTIGSSLADHIPFPGAALYAASKSALSGLTRGLAREVGPQGITAVLVQPGPTDTEANPAEGPMAASLRDATPLGRYGSPSDIAASVAYLVGEGGRHISGTTLTVDGGHNV